MRHLVLILVSIFGLVGFASNAAEAASAAGTWKSSSGNTFVIPESTTAFDLIKQGPDGSRELIKARWIEGMVGTQFTYTNAGVTCTATFNNRNPDMLRVTCNPGNTASVWNRVADQQTGRGLVGTWYSTTGNTFTIPEKSRTEFDIVVTLTTGKKDLYKARWVDGMVGTQFTYSAHGNPPNTGTRNGDNRDQIRIVDNTGKVSIWYREGTKR